MGLIAPTERQAKVLLGKVLETLQAASPSPAIAHRTATSIRLANGSVILALPGDRPDTVRGLTLDFAALDEAAYVKAEVLRVLLPMLATTGGALVMLSTPAGPMGAVPRCVGEWWRGVGAGDDPRHRLPADFTGIPRRGAA